MDNLDFQILTELKANARQTASDISKTIHLSVSTVIERIKKMEKSGLIQSYTVIGHDARIGNWNRIDTHVTCVGGTVVEDEVNIHTSAVISHKVVVESGAHVGALSFVIRRVKAGTTVMGNPAKKLI